MALFTMILYVDHLEAGLRSEVLNKKDMEAWGDLSRKSLKIFSDCPWAGISIVNDQTETSHLHALRRLQIKQP